MGDYMICDNCENLELRNKYKIVCKINEHQLLDVKECMHFKPVDEE